MTTIEIPLSGGGVALVDEFDAARVIAAGPWHARPHGRTTYAQRHVTRADGARTTQQMHTLIMGVVGVDHRNHDGLDNRRSNLRPASQSQNTANQRQRRDNTSGYRGVSRKRRRWIAQIRVNGVQQHIGTYDTPVAAARAYDAAASAAFGEFAYQNFPQEVAS